MEFFGMHLIQYVKFISKGSSCELKMYVLCCLYMSNSNEVFFVLH